MILTSLLPGESLSISKTPSNQLSESPSQWPSEKIYKILSLLSHSKEKSNSILFGFIIVLVTVWFEEKLYI